MVECLDLKNTQTINSRAEEVEDKFDVCLGRSVASLDKFCSWISNSIKEDGVLIYIIGGSVDDKVLQYCKSDTSLDSLLGNDENNSISEKRALLFEGRDVKRIASEFAADSASKKKKQRNTQKV